MAQNPHADSTLALSAAALAFRFADIQAPTTRVELGIPRGGSFVDMGATRGAVAHEIVDTFGWREGQRTKVKGIPPLRYFGYWPLRTRFFDEKYDGDAALVVDSGFAGLTGCAILLILAIPQVDLDTPGATP